MVVKDNVKDAKAVVKTHVPHLAAADAPLDVPAIVRHDARLVVELDVVLHAVTSVAILVFPVVQADVILHVQAAAVEPAVEPALATALAVVDMVALEVVWAETGLYLITLFIYNREIT